MTAALPHRWPRSRMPPHAPLLRRMAAAWVAALCRTPPYAAVRGRTAAVQPRRGLVCRGEYTTVCPDSACRTDWNTHQALFAVQIGLHSNHPHGLGSTPCALWHLLWCAHPRSYVGEVSPLNAQHTGADAGAVAGDRTWLGCMGKGTRRVPGLSAEGAAAVACNPTGLPKHLQISCGME